MSKPAIGLACLAILAGCAGKRGSEYVPVPPSKIEPVTVRIGEEATLFPAKVGDEWVYEIENAIQRNNRVAQGQGFITLKVVKVEPVGDGKRITMDLSSKGRVQDRQVWLLNSKGLYQVSLGLKGERTFNPPLIAIQFPVEAGKKFSWSGKSGKSDMAVNAVIVGAAEVDTAEKRMSAIQVDSKYTIRSGKSIERPERSVWFEPGIGIVRIKETSTRTGGAAGLTLALAKHNFK